MNSAILSKRKSTDHDSNARGKGRTYSTLTLSKAYALSGSNSFSRRLSVQFGFQVSSLEAVSFKVISTSNITDGVLTTFIC